MIIFTLIFCRALRTPANHILIGAAVGRPFLPFVTPPADPVCVCSWHQGCPPYLIPGSSSEPVSYQTQDTDAGFSPVLHHDRITEGHCCLWLKYQPWKTMVGRVKDLSTGTTRTSCPAPSRLPYLTCRNISEYFRGKRDPVASYLCFLWRSPLTTSCQIALEIYPLGTKKDGIIFHSDSD